MKNFVEPMDQETIYMIKDKVIEAFGKEEYYDLIGNRVEYIVGLKKKCYKELLKVIDFTHELFGTEKIDEVKAFRIVVLNEADQVVRREADNPCEEFLMTETALMELAYEVYLDM